LRNDVVVGSVGPAAAGFADFNAPPDTTLAYTVVAEDASGNSSVPSSSVTAKTPVLSAADPYVLAVGDIACDPTDRNFNAGNGTATSCRQKATSDIAFNSNPAAVLSLGDSQYESGTLAAYNQAYDPSWGRVRSITKPIPGNHEYLTSGASGYFNYFGTAAGNTSKSWYSYDVGTWHLVALNGECGFIGGCQQGSPEEQWLAADLAAHPDQCTLVYWHEPRFSSGALGSDAAYAPFWRTAHAAGVDIVLNGHEHNYERFAPQDADGASDATGPREFVVGTGGAETTPAGATQPNSELFQGDLHGALKLTLRSGSYDWSFQNDGSSAFTDSGSAPCH